MDRLSALDAAFLAAEDADPHVSMAIASVGIFDGKAPGLDDLADAFNERLPLLPRYRQRVRGAPLNLGPPVWAEDQQFDLRFHLRRTALPSPGGDAELTALVGRVMATRLDRDRPLWETWVVEGLAGRRWAIISKVHHCMVDGIAGTELYHLLLSTSPEWTGQPAQNVTVPVPRPPSDASVLGSSLAQGLSWPARAVQTVAAAARHPRQTVEIATTTARGLLAMAHVMRPVPASSLTGRIGRQRRYAATTFPLATVKDISHQHGCTINDVMLAAVTAGFRAMLTSRGEPCRHDAVRTLVPVSVRRVGHEGDLANKVSCMFADLPVHLEDSGERLRNVHEQLVAAKQHHEAQAGEVITELGDREPFVVLAPLLRTAFRLPQRSLVTVTTNVPGPREPLYLMGRRMRRLLPYVPIADGVRVGVAMLSYCDEMSVGVSADYDTGADVEVLLRGVREELAALSCVPV